MIQRIQTLFWAFAVVLVALFMFLPCGQLSVPKGDFILYSWGIYDESSVQSTLQYAPLFILSLLLLVSLIISIFTFKKRTRQLRWATISLLLAIGAVLLTGYYAYFVIRWAIPKGVTMVKYPLVFPIIVIILCALGRRGVLKDIAFLNRMNRLR